MDQATVGFSSAPSGARTIEQARIMGPSPPPERRHSFRVCVPGQASIWRKNQLYGHYTVHDLCLEGCSLVGGPSCPRGETVQVVLHLRDSPLIWLAAQVRRSQGETMALRFTDTPPRVEDLLQDLVVDVYAREHADGQSFSLVIEPRPALRHALVKNLDGLGQRAVGVATPLDAVQLLLERGDRVQTAFIGPQPTRGPSFEWLEFLARHYPRVRRVLMGDASQLADAWLAEATGEVDALLETPCTDEALRKLVHRISALPHESVS